MFDNHKADLDQTIIEVEVPHDGGNGTLLQLQLVDRYAVLTLQGEIICCRGRMIFGVVTSLR